MTNPSNPNPTGREQLTAAVARLSAAHAAELSEFAPRPLWHDLVAKDQMDAWRRNSRIVVGEDRDRVAEDEADAHRLESQRLEQLIEWRHAHRCVDDATDSDRVAADERDAHKERVARNAWALVEAAADSDDAWSAGAADLPVRAPGRAQAIAAIHAYADWLTANPSVPVPDAIDSNSYFREAHEPDPLMREAYVKAWAAEHGAELTHGGVAIFATVRVADVPTHGVEINHSLLSNLERRPAL